MNREMRLLHNMNYQNTISGIFLKRPNRFIAIVLVEGRETVCHVKNTGRCRELLIPGVEVVLEYHPDAEALGRKTSYSLISVYKATNHGCTLINMDSQAPNKAAWEWLAGNGLSEYGAVTEIRREVSYKNSRFDLSFLLNQKPAYMEVKGVTLEKDGTALFPDAPTERGIKHLQELMDAASSGYGAFILFIIQLKGVRCFRPNSSTHPKFAQTLKQAHTSGVHVLAYDCMVAFDSLRVDLPVALELPV